MENYNTLEEKIKEEMANYIGKLINGLGKVDGKFISDIVSGILTKNSIILSDIFRAKYGQEANIKKGVEIKPYINNSHLYFVDDSEIVKD